MRPVLLLTFAVFSYLIFLTLSSYSIHPIDLPVKSSALKGANDSVTTIVMFRHGEKPKNGLGSLDCQGLHRSLALPQILQTKFEHKPYYLLAPNPSGKIFEHGSSYSYIRPLQTISPMAIKNELPIDTEINFDDVKTLHDKLNNPIYSNATVFVAWEHKKLVEVARMLMATYKNTSTEVPNWADTDFDSLYVFKITRVSGGGKIEFSVDTEGLNGQSATC